MGSQIWMKSEEKWAYVLVLEGNEVHRLKVTGNMLTLKRKLQGVLEALQQGQEPAAAGAKTIETFDIRTLRKAQVSPGNGSLTLYGGEDGSQELKYTTADDDADKILQAVLTQAGLTFQSTQEEVGVGEALIPPVVIGAIGGLFCAGLYQSAGRIAAGEHLEAKRIRHRGLEQLMIRAAEILGATGTVVVSVALVVLVVGWAARRIIHRPERTVWLPEPV